ncbi:amidohydrolase family protein [Legionella jordanis]|uniref:5-carboxyvanillate decarboxylase n=1 Tax=Legionella jordanis TaxID=456 RepID=A0A0W0VEC4_9GAMM|nr:amidohydrolase family protein [Legionella jordanis]KTD18450.1 5-carboxyvanillate decarboxylase [Legionella jordanis]RMX05355.1 amidohydrolase [Legionella jordanis]RMX20796.1 amidohydrolase [Legionella jordanis]VEH13202.1 5-carboxyvanillate decarboxylase [Legionella jordanis]
MKKIDFENHFYTQKCITYLSQKNSPANIVAHENSLDSFTVQFSQEVSLFHPEKLVKALLGIGKSRVAEMDKNQIDIQILSLSVPSGVDSSAEDAKQAPSLARDANDVLFEAIEAFPERFRGFAAIAPYEVEEGVKELIRAINELKFIGWLTHSNFGPDEYLDNRKYWPLLEAAESLNVPVYIHPTVPTMKEFAKYGFALAGSAVGFQFDTALCLMRMILSGVFDRFPRLKIILGHLGETLVFLMERLDHMYRYPDLKSSRPAIQRIPSEVLKENVYITTSGRFYVPALHYVIKAMGEDRILFATDYPMESMEESVAFIENAMLPKEVQQKIFSENGMQFVHKGNS